jgi:tRNA pseudouridine38-40 synthase
LPDAATIPLDPTGAAPAAATGPEAGPEAGPARGPATNPPGRVALGVSYRGGAYQGWQSQPGGATVQDRLEDALARFATEPVRTLCAGRTDAGVHGLNQVVHFDPPVERDPFAWLRGTNRWLPADIAVQWCRPVPARFHARNSACGRRYRYVLLESPVRPALDSGLVGWVFRPLDGDAMRAAAAQLIGEHDFSAFRAAACQAASPVKTLRAIEIRRRGAYWRFDFDASAFLHHMVRNLMGCLIAVGSGREHPGWMAEVLASRRREAAAPTFAADGLYFVGPYYDAAFALPDRVPAMDWLP